MMEWLELPPLDIPPGLGAFSAAHPLASRILARRGILTEADACAFIDPDAAPVVSPFDLPGMQAAVERILLAARRKEKIAVWGDFDVDGQTATAILKCALQRLGVQPVTRLPVRARESHGIHLKGVQDLIDDGAQLIVTCDSGIDACEEAEYARTRGVDFIVTDHHSLPDELPPALAIINPHLLPAGHAFETLPGAGVAFQLARALAEAAPKNGEPPRDEDLVALAVVADLVPLHGEARALLQRGLRLLRTAPRRGLALLLENNGVDAAVLTENTVAYVLAPRLNAPGRLTDPNPLVDFYLSQDDSILRPLAQEMEALLARVRLTEDEVLRSVRSQMPSESALRDVPAILAAGEGWDGGVLGKVAGRLAEDFHKPVLVISFDARTGRGRGSGRAPQGVDLSAVLAGLDHLLESHGGHPAAAGFSLRAENLEAFRREFLRALNHLPSVPEAMLEIEGLLTLKDLTLERAEEIEFLAPFGKGNALPVFMSRDIDLCERVVIGKDKEHARLTVQDGRGERAELLWWGGASKSLPPAPFDLVYTLRVAYTRGKPGVEIAYVDARKSPNGTVAGGNLLSSQRKIVDLRREPASLARLQELLRVDPEIQVWAEGPAAAYPALKKVARSRSALNPCIRLVVWTAPPSADVYRETLEANGAQEVILFAEEDTEIAAPEAFLRRLAGAVKYALRARDGETPLSSLAAATGSRENSVLDGLDFLACRGDIAWNLSEDAGGTMVRLRQPGSAGDEGALSAARERLLTGLRETHAYRAFFRRANPAELA